MPVLEVLAQPWTWLETEMAIELGYRAHMAQSLPDQVPEGFAGLFQGLMLSPTLELAKYR